MLPIGGENKIFFVIKCSKFVFLLLILIFLTLGSCAHHTESVAGGGAIEIVADKGCITISIDH